VCHDPAIFASSPRGIDRVVLNKPVLQSLVILRPQSSLLGCSGADWIAFLPTTRRHVAEHPFPKVRTSVFNGMGHYGVCEGVGNNVVG
jgi:hypothetical protein